MVRAALLAREMIVKTRVQDTRRGGRWARRRLSAAGFRFPKLSGCSWGRRRAQAVHLGVHVHHLQIDRGSGSARVQWASKTDPSIGRIFPEEFAAWSLKSYLNTPEACHVIAPLSLMLYSTPKDRLFPASRVGTGPFTMKSPHGERQTTRRLFLDEPTTIRELDGGYVGFRYPCDIQRLVFGMRDDLYLDSQGSVFFKLQLFVPPSCEPSSVRSQATPTPTRTPTTAIGSIRRRTPPVTAILEDGLGEAKMRGIVFVTDDDALRFILRAARSKSHRARRWE